MVDLKVCILREASFGKSQMLLCMITECATLVWLHADGVALYLKWIFSSSSSSFSLELGSGWILAPVFTLFLRLENPTEKKERRMNKKDTCLWFRELDHTAARRWKWVTFLSPSIPLSLGPSTGGNLRMSSQVSVVFQPPSHQSDIVPHLLYVKTVQRAIWLWVMEGGLNSPSEILEPVGKPQLFKCRKSWFYKMLIWSTLGKSEQNGSEKGLLLPQPHLHLFRGVERERKGTKGGRAKWRIWEINEMEKVRKRLTFILFTLSNQFHHPPADRQPQTGKRLLYIYIYIVYDAEGSQDSSIWASISFS